jgi:Flp pilus assembly secretin CpaC
MRRAVILALFAAISSIAGVAPAVAGTFSVPMDEVRILTFKKPVSTIYVGNTVYADATLIDSKHAFLLGKTMGETNMIAMGADGKIVSNEQITVFGRRVGMVTLNRGATQFNFACTSLHCETQPVPGDVSDYFKVTHDSQTQHEDMANKAASGGSTGTLANAAPAQ